MKRGAANIIFWSTLALLGLLFLAPLGTIIRGGFIEHGRFTPRYLLGVFANPIYAEGLGNSLLIALGTTLLAMLCAVPLAWLANRYRFPGKDWIGALLLAPMILPPFVGAIGLQQLLGQYGALNALLSLGPVDWIGRARYWGVVGLQALSLYPLIYLNAVAALANIDPAMEEAAENVGCHGFRKFRRITLPLIMPGLFAGGTLVFIWSFTELGTPLIMNYTRCAAVQVFDALKEVGSNPFPYALVFVMLAASVLLYTAAKLVFGRAAWAMQGKATVAARQTDLRGWRAAAARLPFLVVIGLALLPHIGVILTSFSEPGSWYRTVLPTRFTTANYAAALGHGMVVSGIGNSLLYATLAAGFSLVLGLLIAFVVVRSDLPQRGALDAVAMLPLAVPGLVMAFGYLAISSRLSNLEWVRNSPLAQQLFDVRVNPTLFLVVAYAVRRLPYVVRAAVAGLQQTAVALEEAAANVGAGPLTTARRITIPLIAANLVAGGLLAFAFSMLEVSDSLILAQQSDHFPITKTIYELFQLIGTGKYLACALGVWAMLFLAVALAGSHRLLGRKLGAVFRV